MSKEDVEKAIEEVMEVVDEQLFAIDGTKAEAKAFHNGIIAACKRRIADAKADSADVEPEGDIDDDDVADDEEDS